MIQFPSNANLLRRVHDDIRDLIKAQGHKALGCAGTRYERK